MSDSETGGKDQPDADRIGPVTRGRWGGGPEWYCGECMRGDTP